MKCQIAAQRLRFRIDEAELDRLLRDGEIEDVTAFSPAVRHVRRLRLLDAPTPELRDEGATLTVALPRSRFEGFAVERPRRDGFEFDWPVAGAERLRVVVEIDVRDSRRRARSDRDESGAV